MCSSDLHKAGQTDQMRGNRALGEPGGRCCGLRGRDLAQGGFGPWAIQDLSRAPVLWRPWQWPRAWRQTVTQDPSGDRSTFLIIRYSDIVRTTLCGRSIPWPFGPLVR